MRNRFMLALTAAPISVVVMAGVVMATNPQGVTSTTLAVGRFANIDANTKTDNRAGARRAQLRPATVRLSSRRRAVVRELPIRQEKPIP